MRTAVGGRDLHKCSATTVWLTWRIHTRLKSHMTCYYCNHDPTPSLQSPPTPPSPTITPSILAWSEKLLAWSSGVCKHEQSSQSLVFHLVVDSLLQLPLSYKSDYIQQWTSSWVWTGKIRRDGSLFEKQCQYHMTAESLWSIFFSSQIVKRN